MAILREGDLGAAALKARLNALNYDCGDGDLFDRRTTWAVKWFQRQNGLPAEGVADEATLSRIDSDAAVPGVTEAEPFYSMKDEMWAKYPYKAANTATIERMEDSSCGPTSMAIAATALLRRAILPPVLADWSNAHGFRDPDGEGGTDDAFFPAIAAQYGLETELVPLDGAAAFDRVANELAQGSAVICNVVPGSPYTKYGHYNLIAALRDGRVRISDPNPVNAGLPDYAIGEWLENHWGRHCIFVRKAK